MVSMKWNGDRVSADVHSSALRGADKAAHRLRGLSVARAPVRDGILRGSAAVTVSGSGAAVSYNTPYAVRQHEELDYQHPQGGQAKYLEGPLKEREDELLDIIAASVRRSLNG